MTSASPSAMKSPVRFMARGLAEAMGEEKTSEVASSYPPLEGRAIAYGSCACAVASREQSAPTAASKRSLFDSGLFSIRFCCAGASDTRQRWPSRGWDSKISICDTPALQGRVKEPATLIY